MGKTYLIIMTIFVIGGVVSSLPVPEKSTTLTSLKTKFSDFQSNVIQLFLEFGNKIASQIVSESTGSLRLEEVVNMVITFITDLATSFLESIMYIVTDILLSMWYNPRPTEEVLQEMTDRFTEEFYKLFKSLYELIVYLVNYFGKGLRFIFVI